MRNSNILKYTFIFFVMFTLFFTSKRTTAQNLVLNPDFEARNCCPEEYSQFRCTKSWTRPANGTSDYYSSCENKYDTQTVKVPNNFMGYQEAVSGEAYVGIYSFYEIDHYREYIQGQLSEPLQAGKEYCIQLNVNLADSVGVAIASLGIRFSKIRTKEYHFRALNGEFLPLKHDSLEYLSDRESWMHIQTTYTAKGGEMYFIIGNFNNNYNTDTLSIQTDYSFSDEDQFSAYYYIDDVCVAPKTKEECNCFPPEKYDIVPDSSYIDLFTSTDQDSLKPKLGERVILKNIYFNTDKASLLPASIEELDRLVALLNKYPSMEIEIGGHTDNQGSFNYNIGLSDARAQSVFTYLVSNGISSARLSFRGYGETMPIAENRTSEGRQLNRRVEFLVTKE